MADYDQPTLIDLYGDFLALLKERDIDVLKWLEGQTVSNLPAGAKRWNATNNNFERWDGLAWQLLSALYEIKVRDSGKLNNQTEAFYRNAGNLNAGTLAGARFDDSSHGNRDGGTLHAVATAVLAGFMAAADKSKLDGIESGATADQTASEILTLLKTVDGAGSGLDGDLLDGKHASAFHQVGGTDVPITDGGTGASDAATARANLGLGSLATLDLVGQAALNTTTGEASVTNNNITWILPGGEYGFFVQMRSSAGQNMGWFDSDFTGSGLYVSQTNSTSYVMVLRFGAIVATTAYMMQRYIQASPPYDLGDGEVPLFVFVVVDKSGNIEAVSVTQDPPWANNGPTNIRHDYLKNKKPFKKIYRQKRDKGKLILPIELEEQEIELTPEYKNTDMPLIPHPFKGNDLKGKTILLVDPVSDLCCHFGELHDKGQSINELLHEGHIRIENTPLSRKTPPGVIAVSPRWKLTR